MPLFLLLGLWGVGTAHARPVSVEKATRTGLLAGQVVEVELEAFDQLLSLDEDILIIEATDPLRGRVTLRTRSAGIGTLLVLRGGMNVTLPLEVRTAARREAFDDVELVARDGIPLYDVRSVTQLSGTGTETDLRVGLSGRVSYQSASRGIDHRTMVSLADEGEKLGLGVVRSDTTWRKGELRVGDQSVLLGTNVAALPSRAVRFSYLPEGDEGAYASLSLGATPARACCELFAPDGDLHALAEGGWRAEDAALLGRAGVVVSREDQRLLPVVGLEGRLREGGFFGQGAVSRLGDGFGAGGVSRWTRGDLVLSGLVTWLGRGAWVPGLGTLEGSRTNGYVNARTKLGLRATGWTTVSFTDLRIDRSTRGEAAMGVQFGGRSSIGFRYGLGFSAVDGALDLEQWRHRIGSSIRLVGARGAFSADGTLSLASTGFDGLLLRSKLRQDLGSIYFTEPSLWLVASPTSVNVSLGHRVGWEKAVSRGEAGVTLQSVFGAGRAVLTPRLDGRVESRLSRWASGYLAGSIGTQLRKLEPRYATTVGLRLSGSLLGVGGTVGSGGSVRGVAFRDDDADGVFDAEEIAIGGVSVRIVDREGRTDDDGGYRVRGLLPGQYPVEVDAPGYHVASDALVADVFRARAGRLDIPLVEKKRVDLHVFADGDGDGVLGLADWSVPASSLHVQGPDYDAIVDLPDGQLTLEGLPPGDYTVRLMPALVEPGYILADAPTKPFAIDARGFRRVTFAVEPQRSIEGHVCEDRNGNGRRDGADVCEEGVLVELTGGRRTLTRAEGRFHFDDLEPGDYTVTAAGTASDPVVIRRVPVEARVELLAEPARQAKVAETVERVDPIALRTQLVLTELKVGERVPLSAKATYPDLTQQTVRPTWIVEDPSVLRIEKGRVHALTQGRTTVRARLGQLESPPVEVLVRHLPVIGLNVDAFALDLELGEVEPLAVRGIYVNGDADDVTDQVRWETSDPEVVQVDGNGVVVAKGPGFATVRGTFFGVATAPVEVRVGTGDVLPTRLEVSPRTLTLGEASVGRVYADGELPTGAEVHLSHEVRWETDRPDVVDVLPGGRIRPRGVGQARVWCSYKGVRSKPSRVEVVAGVGLVVVPTLSAVPVGRSVPIQAFQILEDGSFAELTKVRWQSSDPARAEVDEGKLVVRGVGPVEIRARFKGVESLPVTIEGTNADVAGLEISEERLLLQVGERAWVDALARFSDGRVSTATSAATWLTSDEDVVSVSSDGELVAHARGRALVQARWLGRKSPPVEVVVDAGEVEEPAAILVQPGQITLSAQGHQPIAASVVAGSGRSLPTGSVQWEVADPSIAWVEDGRIRAVSVGSTSVVARVGELQSEPVEVVVEPIVGVTATPAVGRLPVGARVDLKALAIVGNGDVEDLTDTGSVRWTSSDPEVLQIDATGRLLAFSAGEAEIVGTWRNIETQPIPVEVADVALDTLLIEPEIADLRVNETLPLAVVAVFSDGERADALPHVTWTSTRPDVLSVEDGVLSGLEPGVAEVFASWMGVQSEKMRVTVAVANAVGVILGHAAEVMPVGTRTALRSSAVTEDGKLLEASEQTVWRVGDPDVAQVDANGILEARSPGSTTIEGEVGGVRSPAIAVEVTDAAVLRLAIRPGALAVRPGDPADILVQAVLDDGRTVDVTPLVQWEIDGIGLESDRFGVLRAQRGTSARVRARLAGVRSDWASVVAEE